MTRRTEPKDIQPELRRIASMMMCLWFTFSMTCLAVLWAHQGTVSVNSVHYSIVGLHDFGVRFMIVSHECDDLFFVLIIASSIILFSFFWMIDSPATFVHLLSTQWGAEFLTVALWRKFDAATWTLQYRNGHKRNCNINEQSGRNYLRGRSPEFSLSFDLKFNDERMVA